MKSIVILFLAIFACCTIHAQKKIYLNPGHGSWGPNDRPMATIPYPNLSSTGRPDTCGFYESNTNLWKCEETAKRLQKDGYTIIMSRYANGPYPYTTGTGSTKYNRNLSEICQEVEEWGGDMFLSVHSNASTDGTMTNYPLFLYRGKDTQNYVSNSKNMCTAIWPFLVEAMKNGLEYQSYYSTSTNIRGDIDFYHSSSTNAMGYEGYLGVLKHGTPGFLSEGYFHTYQPARHRALNPDWCRQEGIRYYRGIVNYFGTKKDTKGYIMGVVKDKTENMDTYNQYTYKSGTHDEYLPIMGATVRLLDSNMQLIDTYKTDNKYNGVFVFYNLTPGKYYIELEKDGYASQNGKMNEVTVTANTTTYPIYYMQHGPSTFYVNITGDGKLALGDTIITEGQTKKVVVAPGVDAKFIVYPNTGTNLSSVFLNKEDITNSVAKSGELTITPTKTTNNLDVVFKKNLYTVKVTNRSNGTIELLDSVISKNSIVYLSVEHGKDILLKVTPKENYRLKSCKINSIEKVNEFVNGTYTIEKVSGELNISLSYESITGIDKKSIKVANIIKEDNKLILQNIPTNTRIQLWDSKGMLLHDSYSDGATHTIQFKNNSLYILKYGNKTIKIK